jgi:hypothetical protein
MNIFKRSSAGPPSPTPSSPSDEVKSSWLPRGKAKTFPLQDTHSEQLTPSPTPTPPSHTPTFERPIWFSRSKTVPISRSTVAEDLLAMPPPVQRRLKAEEEYDQLPNWRKEAAKARVAELRKFAVPIQASERHLDNARAAETPDENVTVEKSSPSLECAHEDCTDASCKIDSLHTSLNHNFPSSRSDDLPPLSQDVFWLSLKLIELPALALATANHQPTCRICDNAFDSKSREPAWRLHGDHGIAHAVHVECLHGSDWATKFRERQDKCVRCDVWTEMCTKLGSEETDRRLERVKSLLYR